MHASVYNWIGSLADRCEFPILEIGSQNINGTVRDHFNDEVTHYVGIDLMEAPGVDVVYDGQLLPFDNESFASVLCLEVFEHCFNPCLLSMEIVRVLRPGGIALVSARGNGFGFHNPPDRMRFMPGYLSELFTTLGCAATEREDEQVPGHIADVHKETS